MIIKLASDVNSLPCGELHLTKNGNAFNLAATGEYAFGAAEAIVKSGEQSDFKTRADVIRFAMRHLRWGLARHGYSIN